MIENDADLHKKDMNDDNLLHLAVLGAGKEENNPAPFSNMIRKLLEEGLSINEEDDEGCTPLHIASEYCNFSIIEVLLKNGASLSKQNDDQDTPLDVARDQGCDERVILLLSVDLKEKRCNIFSFYIL